MTVVTDALVVLLIVVPLLPITLLVILVRRQVWRLGSPSLNERTVIALRDAVVASTVAALAANRLLGWNWPRETVLVLTASILLLVSLPSAYWLSLYMRDRFR